ncbi:MAG: hypothetical protein Q4F24_02865 [Eubacteriales bacterium]|nr:hypothetical protein [Eubacteriales bacterium]
MEKLKSAMPYYYGASKESSNNIRFVIEMQDEIDGEMFAKAVKLSMSRYPYFCVRVVSTDQELFLEENKKDVVVAHTNEPITLGGMDANGHLLAFSWWGNQVYLDCFHGLSDGAGYLPLINTVIYYYCRERYDSNLNPEGIRLGGEAIPEEEIKDPYPDSVDDSIKPVGRYVRKPAFDLRSAGLCTPGNPFWYEVQIPEDAFMKYNRSNDASPAVMIGVLMARAVEELHKDADKPIVCSMAMNIRKTLHAMTAHHSLVTQLFLEYKEAMKKMDIREQATCFRGMIMIQGQDENIWQSVKGNLKINERIHAMPDMKSKRMMTQQIVESCVGLDTFKVSYVGKNHMGAAEKYVKGMHVVLDMNRNNMMIEVSAVHGWFHLTFQQNWAEDVYVKAFLRQLDKEGITYKAKEGQPIKVASIDF